MVCDLGPVGVCDLGQVGALGWPCSVVGPACVACGVAEGDLEQGPRWSGRGAYLPNTCEQMAADSPRQEGIGNRLIRPFPIKLDELPCPPPLHADIMVYEHM